MSKENRNLDDELIRIRDFDRFDRVKPNRRIGTHERDMHSEYVNEAYAGGYLDNEELGVRRNKILAAKFARDLETVVDDLPSYAELKGRKSVPVTAQKRTFWLINLYQKHKLLAPAVSFILGMLTAITPAVSITSMFPTGKGIPFPFSGIMAFTITLGVFTVVVSLIRFMWVAMEEM
jgi:hypothetical protein